MTIIFGTYNSNSSELKNFCNYIDKAKINAIARDDDTALVPVNVDDNKFIDFLRKAQNKLKVNSFEIALKGSSSYNINMKSWTDKNYTPFKKFAAYAKNNQIDAFVLIHGEGERFD